MREGEWARGLFGRFPVYIYIISSVLASSLISVQEFEL